MDMPLPFVLPELGSLDATTAAGAAAATALGALVVEVTPP
jgi:hypothetical protein